MSINQKKLILDRKTKLGLQVKNLVDNGEFVSDEIILSIISKRISEDDCSKGFILDGFPRNLNQASKFDEILLVGSGKGVVSISSIKKLNWYRSSMKIYNFLSRKYSKLLIK